MKGSVTREENGSWRVAWSTTDPATGKRKQHTRRGFPTKKAGQQFLNGIMGSVQNGSWRGDSDVTVKDLLEHHWLPAQSLRGLRATTLDQYKRVIDAWIVPYIGGIKLAALRPTDVTKMVETLGSQTSAKGRKGLSTRSQQLTVGVLKAACQWALQNELVARNPVAGVQRPRVESRAPRTWTVAEPRRFIGATRNSRMAAAWTLLLTRGLRRGELCGLRWEHVDLDGGTLRIVDTLTVVNGKPAASTPKTAAGRRSVPLDATLVGVLRSHRAKQSSERLKAGAAYIDSGHIVTDELGKPYHPDTVSDWFQTAVTEVGLPRIRLHDLRHTAASLMLASGVPVKVVSEMFGHASSTITLSVYGHVMPGMGEEAGAALSASLLG